MMTSTRKSIKRGSLVSLSFHPHSSLHGCLCFSLSVVGLVAITITHCTVAWHGVIFWVGPWDKVSIEHGVAA